MNVLQHTRNERNPCLKQNRPDRSYRDTLLTEYNIIYTHFSCFFVRLFLQGLINLKNYDDRLYVNVDDLAVWASDFSYRKGWSNWHRSAMTSPIFLMYFTFTHISCWLCNSLKQAVWQRSEANCSFHIFLHIFILLVLERQTILY